MAPTNDSRSYGIAFDTNLRSKYDGNSCTAHHRDFWQDRYIVHHFGSLHRALPVFVRNSGKSVH